MEIPTCSLIIPLQSFLSHPTLGTYPSYQCMIDRYSCLCELRLGLRFGGSGRFEWLWW